MFQDNGSPIRLLFAGSKPWQPHRANSSCLDLGGPDTCHFCPVSHDGISHRGASFGRRALHQTFYEKHIDKVSRRCLQTCPPPSLFSRCNPGIVTMPFGPVSMSARPMAGVWAVLADRASKHDQISTFGATGSGGDRRMYLELEGSFMLKNNPHCRPELSTHLVFLVLTLPIPASRGKSMWVSQIFLMWTNYSV